MKKVNLDNSQIPLHYQIADYLLVMLGKGELDSDERLLSEEELREIFGVSRTTIRRALEHLLNKGLLVRRQGRGTFWTNSAAHLRDEKLAGINRQIFNISQKTTPVFLSKKNTTPLPDVSLFLGLPEEKQVSVIKRLRLDDTDEPMSYTINYMPVEYAMPITGKHLEKMTMLETLEKVVKLNLGTVEHEVEITRANSEIAEQLKISVLDPVLTVTTSVYDTDTNPVEKVWTYFVETKYKFRVVLDKE